MKPMISGLMNRTESTAGRRKSLLQWILVLSMATTLAACGGSGGGGGTPGSSGGGSGGSSGGTLPPGQDPDLAAFQITVYPLVRQHCSECHSPKTVVVPDFAHENVEIAHAEIVNNQKVFLQNPPRSRVVERLLETPAGHNCWGPQAECPANASQMQAAIEKWAELVAAAGAAPPPLLISGTTSLADVGPDPVTVSVDASGIVAGASFEAQVREFDDFSYAIDDLTFVGPDGTRIIDVRFAINEIAPVAAQTCAGVNVTASNGQTLCTGSVIPKDQGPAGDNLSLQFGGFGDADGFVFQPGARPLDDGQPSTAPDSGLRIFSQVCDTFTTVTGINNNATRTACDEFGPALATTADLNGFVNAQQSALQNLAETYCLQVVNNNGACNNLFGACNVNNPQARADAVYANVVGANLVNQPDQAAYTAQLVNIINGQNLAADIELQAVCTTALASLPTVMN